MYGFSGVPLAMAVVLVNARRASVAVMMNTRMPAPTIGTRAQTKSREMVDRDFSPEFTSSNSEHHLYSLYLRR